MKITSIVGARPQFVKLSPMVKAFSARPEVQHTIIHTGQHFDDRMSDVFFRDLDIPKPDINLMIGSGTHGWQTGKMMIAIEEALLSNVPDMVIVYGDTNSTLAGALASAKLNIPVAHVEAGMRCFRKDVPEEINRVVTDHVSSLHFCPTGQAVENLMCEGFSWDYLYQSGDVLHDAFVQNKDRIPAVVVLPGKYVVATVHRQENTDDRNRLNSIISALNDLAKTIPVVLPFHPRIENLVKALSSGITVIDPLPYLDMLGLVSGAEIVLTDSGGLQREAHWLGKMAVVLREETEHMDLVADGWAVLAGADSRLILSSAFSALKLLDRKVELGPLYDGHAANRIAAKCIEWLED
jgi:UDP-GlcNAc3NAcA epimerase